MSMTPWGESSELRLRRLRPGRGIPREDVEENQRQRLYGATVAVVANKGYAESSVSDLIKVAGVSRETFYKYFADKEACFLATLEVILAGATAVTASRVGREEGSWEERGERGLAGFIELLVAQPDAARIAMVEAYAAGPAAQEMVAQAVGNLEALMSYVFEQMPERAGMPAELITGMVGSVRKVIHTRLHRRAEDELVGMVPDLVALAMLYKPPKQRLRSRTRGRRPRASQPGALAGDAADRIEAATVKVIAEHGWADATITRIASAAGVSLGTFYANFDNKTDAFEAATFRHRLQMIAAALPYYRRARSWPEAIRGVVGACLAYFEAESDFARVATIDVYAAGAAALEARDRVIEETERYIADGERYAPLGNPVAAEAILGGLYSMVAERVRKQGTKNLRSLALLATYSVLVPYLGPEEAASVASGEEPRRREWVRGEG
ncbi:MAG: TetR/AcrR family transcriptional regulator [Actinobacteria bacterium]|nr:TetR/AcrR family transcriptional regulator [Actinomycetota bacterium]